MNLGPEYPIARTRSEHRTLLARLLILEILFDGDPASWRDWLLTHGSDTQRAEDLPFVETLCRSVTRTPESSSGRLNNVVEGRFGR